MVINCEHIPVFGIFMLLSLLLNCILSFYFAKIQNIKKNTMLCAVTYEIIGVILGAKILNMIQTKNYSSIYYAGFSSYGGVLGGILFLTIFAKVYKVSLKKLFLTYIPTLPIMYAVSKLGCFFNGCCYGIAYTGIGNVIYEYAVDAPLNIKLFPVQLLETLVNFCIFIYICTIYKANKENFKIISTTLILCGLSKFALEFFRNSWSNQISSTQIISLIFIVIGIFVIKLERKNNEKK